MEIIENGQIVETFLGLEDHGILTFNIRIKLASGITKSYGGFSLEGNSCWKKISKILQIAGVCEWEDLKNKYVRVKYDKEKTSPLSDLGHIIKDDWMSII